MKEDKFEFQIKSSKHSKNIRLTVRPDGKVIITKPIFIPDLIARRFALKHTDWILKNLAKFKLHRRGILSRRSATEYKTNKEPARVLVHKKIEEWNKMYNFRIGTIRIGNQKSRWGSCSRKGNLNFNYKIVYLQKELQDYIIVHELCHLEHLNHSQQFWRLVAEQIPDWKKLRNELKKF
jgi:predicted metal-dependent hydrolase